MVALTYSRPGKTASCPAKLLPRTRKAIQVCRHTEQTRYTDMGYMYALRLRVV
ncbi:hypothetical protein RSAG8_01384, partial [Rhizoctonia solani AG-8 WAC10335]